MPLAAATETKQAIINVERRIRDRFQHTTK